ncbi:MAG TPA: PIN domain-containing protein [Syntrophobacteraceae bacterium]|nr:PIN domain-containing protein [Syntrophobacteraceae bacterium]
MRFWDSSALVPLLVGEEKTGYCLKVLVDDPEMLIWCLSRVEVVSALCRRVREGALGEDEFRRAKQRLNMILDSAYEVTAVEKVGARALRLLEVHSLRAADACQLAAALVGTQEDPDRLALLCFNQRLETAAVREGFVVNPGWL